MPGRKTQIPSTIQKSDKHAQSIWRKAHDSAVKTYGEGRTAHRVAYAALKHQYEKKGDHWEKKGWKGPSDPQAAQGYRDKPKLTAGGKVARTVEEAREKAKEARREASAARVAAKRTNAVKTGKKAKTAKKAVKKATKKAKAKKTTKKVAKKRRR